ncbi:MAG: PorP/SprF family type IX secretion system membrane protein [Bacteroidota bacterium]|nr:PorP/SprF family type IX secretion system membrane protein [Bacteroidota bacterium]
MKRTLFQLAVIFLLIASLKSSAQDSRFSQYFNNPLLLNPAMAGNGIEYIRVTAIYRTQWAGMGTPFTTQGFAVDKVVNRIGIGAVITRNSAGDASMRTLNFVGNLSYHLPVGSRKINTLSGGIQIGVVNKSFDPSKLTFDNQYNPDAGYDPNMSSGEDFSATSVTRPDLNIGFGWQRGWMKKDVRFKPFLGLSYSHLTKPDETFIMEATKVHRKRTVYGGAGYLFESGFEIRPSFMLLQQGPSKETTFGSLVSYQLDNKNAVQLGVYNRMQDAIIAYAGYQMNLLFVGMSYDVNTSELSKSGKGNNAFEISLTYSPRPRKKKAPVVKAEEVRTPAPDAIGKMVKITTPVSTITVPEHLEFTPVLPVVETTKVATEIKEKAVTVDSGIPEITRAKAVVVTTRVAEDRTVTPALPHITPAVSIVKNEITNLSVPDQTIVATYPAKAESVITTPVLQIPVTITKPISSIKEKPAVKTDSDNDGVPDSEDECPYIKGKTASKGCPDSDGDGLVDMKDDCPMESGTVANKGCPDREVPAPVNNQQLVKKFDNILFATGLVKLTTDDIFDIIERAIDIMYADKTTKVLLSGHTDSEGDAYQNMILSQARAEVVKRYMIQQGIDASRIETVAYGETMPLDNNHTGAGKKLNRRVEINILKK